MVVALAGCANASVPDRNVVQDDLKNTPERSDVPLAYQNIERVQVLCLVQTERGVARETDRTRLCDLVADGARRGTDLPVSVIATGDPAVVAPGRITILVHGSLVGSDRIALTMRPYRPAIAGSDVLFGSMLRVADFSDDAELESAISASLDEILP